MVTDRIFNAFDEGVFKEYFEKYIEFKRGKGYQVGKSILIRLKSLNNSLNRYCCGLEIDSSTVEEILRERSQESPATRALRISDMRQFCSFLNGLGVHTYQIPKKYAKGYHNTFRPHIFSEVELTSLIDAADHFESRQWGFNFFNVYPFIIRILVGTGLRIGELLSLRVGDVDFTNKSLTVHLSKNVSRHVPMSNSLSVAVLRYISEAPHKNDPKQFLFVSPYTGSHYSYSAMKYMIKKLFKLANITTTKGKLPRIHDIRHSFCTMSLNRMLESGLSLYAAIPRLAAYVGHVNLCDTERYIHLTEHDYSRFLQKEQNLRKLIPEAPDYDE